MKTDLSRRATKCRGDLLPNDRLTIPEATAILGVSSTRVWGLICEGFLTEDLRDAARCLVRAQVEDVSLSTYDRMAHRHDPYPYWVSGHRAADALGVSHQQLDALSANGRIPYLLHPDGTVLYRRQQLLNLRHVREGRGWHQS